MPTLKSSLGYMTSTACVSEHGDARAIAPKLVTRHGDPARERAFLAALGRWAGRFTPWVAEDDEALVLDVTGCAGLFGGEAGLVAQVEAEAAGFGLTLGIGLADTLGAVGKTIGAAVGVPVSIELGGLPPEKWADRMLRAIDQISEEALGRIREQRRATGLEQFRAALNPMMTGAGFHDLAMAAGTTFPPRRDQAADTQAARAAGIGFAAVQLPPVPPDVQQLMLDLRQRYDPMTTLAPFRQQLDQIRDRGLLGDRSQQFTDAAWRERLRDVGARFGLDDQHPRLPSATEVGSAEDARLMIAWASQRTEQSTESLLQQIINLASQQLGVQSKTLEFVAKPVVMLKPPP